MFPASFKIILCALLIATVLSFSRISNAGDRLVFAVHPYLPATEISEKFGPLVKYLSKELGRPIDIEISPDYQNHIVEIGKDNVDIAYMGPASYVKMADTYGRKHLLVRQETDGKPTFHGVIIVRRDSTIKSLDDLAGKRFVFGDPESTMSHLVPRYMLWKEGITLDNLGGYAFLANHHNVALGVLAGDFDAGAVKEEVFDEYEKRGLRELVRTPEISDHVIVATNRLSPEKIQRLREALHSLRGKEAGRDILNSIKPSISLAPAKDEDYDNLREILKALTKLGIYK